MDDPRPTSISDKENGSLPGSILALIKARSLSQQCIAAPSNALHLPPCLRCRPPLHGMRRNERFDSA